MNTLPIIIDYANRSFRDLADQDYIAARFCYRYGLDQLFLWNSLQAIEKYLKSILLYNMKSSRGIGHDLCKALDRVRAIKEIPFDFPEDVLRFIEYLNQYGKDRYLVQPTHIRDRALLYLDKTVWHIRRYCLYIQREITKPDGTIVNVLELELRRIHSPYYIHNWHKYKLFGGYLEKSIQNNALVAEHIIWKNFFFGRKRKEKIRNYTIRISSTNPTHFMHPESFEELDKLVDFPKFVRKQFKANGAS